VGSVGSDGPRRARDPWVRPAFNGLYRAQFSPSEPLIPSWTDSPEFLVAFIFREISS
jgi:hypothetical protein